MLEILLLIMLFVSVVAPMVVVLFSNRKKDGNIVDEKFMRIPFDE